MQRLADPAAAKLIQRLTGLYPVLASLPASLLAPVLQAHALAITVPAGQQLFGEGQACIGFPLLLTGELRVGKGSAHGRSLELYRLVPGDLCAASTACLMGPGVHAAHAVAAQASELLLLDAEGFEQWTTHRPFRQQVFGLFAQRLTDLMALAEAVAFQRLDQRLAGTLLDHGPVVRATHQGLADDLGTAREIVTRLLKRFEREGWVQVSRERVEILDIPALRVLATTGNSAVSD
jgi:CRP/FNR family transcriptional regulator